MAREKEHSTRIANRIQEINRRNSAIREQLEQLELEMEYLAAKPSVPTEPRLKSSFIPPGHRTDTPLFDEERNDELDGDRPDELNWEDTPMPLPSQDFVPSPAALKPRAASPGVEGGKAIPLYRPNENDRFRSYFANKMYKPKRQVRIDHEAQKRRAIFGIIMVFLLSFILWHMLT